MTSVEPKASNKVEPKASNKVGPKASNKVGPKASNKVERVVLLVLDGLGVGALPDAGDYGDEGSDTLGGVLRAHPVRLAWLERMGLGRLGEYPGLPAAARPEAAVGRMRERSAGKDSTTGHWEIAGLVLKTPFPTYPGGFPPDLVGRFEGAIGRRVLGNEVASGTEIIDRLGPRHLATGCPILYTSADSVFQIAAHEEVIPPERLYDYCRTARALLVEPHHVGRVIARPFVGRPGAFHRTANRRDFSIPPVGPTLLDRLGQAGVPVVAVGKIADLFAGRGITELVRTQDDQDGLRVTIRTLGRLNDSARLRDDRSARLRLDRGLIFTNLVDLDSKYGHRNDAPGFAEGLQRIDQALPSLQQALGPRDVLILTGDHGNDPTTPSTDHSREYVPLLVGGRGIRPTDLGTRSTFADVGETIAEWFGVPGLGSGRSFADILDV